MTVNTTLAGLSQTAASNGPDGAVDAPSTLDDAIRYHGAFIAKIRDDAIAFGLTTAGGTATATTSEINAAADKLGAFRRGTLLGTVSQSAGTPTGAIIERGSNSNGDYVRFADGTQICTVRVDSSAQAFTLYVAPIYISSYSWTFPAAFIAAPVVTCSEFKWGTSASWGGTGGAPSATTVGLRGYDAVANATGTSTLISAAAVGRWF